MKMAYFINKWANKAIEEYKTSGNLETLVNEHFMLAFDKGSEMIEEIEKVELSAKYSHLEEDEIQEMLVDKVQAKIDVLMDGVEIEEASEVEEIVDEDEVYYEKDGKVYIKHGMEKQHVLLKMKKETFETLTERGRGVELEQWCLYAGISHYGTSDKKATRLLEWYKSQSIEENTEMSCYLNESDFEEYKPKKTKREKIKINIKTPKKFVPVRINKTLGNLNRLYDNLDNALGNLHNAMEDMVNMKLPRTMRDKLDRLSVDLISSLKQEVELMIEEKEDQVKEEFRKASSHKKEGE